MDQFLDWIYSQLIGFFGNFFSVMGNMGIELFEMNWVKSIILFFSYLAWALYGVGLVVAIFEVGIEYQTGRANVKDAALNAVKGFLAVGCFTLVPVLHGISRRSGYRRYVHVRMAERHRGRGYGE